MKDYVDAKIIERLFYELNNRGINYVLIKNIGEELPHRLINGKDIDIVVNYDDVGRFHALMSDLDFSNVCHPYAKDKGWSYLYGLEEFEFWKYNSEDFSLYVDVTTKLCCRSLMPNTWVPLDDYIQKVMWEKRIWDEEKKWWITDVNIRYMYCVARCIFDKNGVFSQGYRDEIEKLSSVVDNRLEDILFEKIFFKAGKFVLSLVIGRKYDDLRKLYIQYNKY